MRVCASSAVRSPATYPQLLVCYLSGQISERQWHVHLKDEVFRAWLHRNSNR